jgi:hypothetical protein
MNLLFLLNIINFMIICNSLPFRSHLFPDECNSLNNKISCNKYPGCAWCTHYGWNSIYNCIKIKDDTDCINQIVNDCIKVVRCNYCIFNVYATWFCYKSLFSEFKIYGI